MEQYLSEYLFTYKCCPLPGIGELQFSSRSATFSQSEQTMIPSAQEIVFVRRNVDEEELLKFISRCGGASVEESRKELKLWCNELSNIEAGEKYIAGVGSFYIDASGRLQFRSQTLHSALLPEVSAERVIRKESNHQILVGDKESTSVQMTEYFQETARVRKHRWWVAATALATVSAVAIVIYFTTSPRPGFSGNRNAIPQSTPAPTYVIPR